MNRTACLLVAAALCSAASLAEVHAEELHGYVLDKYSVQTNKGIPRVYIKLAREDQTIAKEGIQTNQQGRYDIKGIERGTYFVIASKALYEPDPHKTTKVEIPVADDEAPTIELEQKYGSRAYYEAAGHEFVRNGKDKYPAMWRDVIWSGLPPTSIAKKVHWIDKLDSDAAELVSGIEQYKNFDEKKYQRVYAAVGEARKGNAPFPMKIVEDANLGGDVILGLMIQQMQNSTSKEEGSSFVERVKEEWKPGNEHIKVLTAGTILDHMGRPRFDHGPGPG